MQELLVQQAVNFVLIRLVEKLRHLTQHSQLVLLDSSSMTWRSSCSRIISTALAARIGGTDAPRGPHILQRCGSSERNHAHGSGVICRGFDVASRRRLEGSEGKIHGSCFRRLAAFIVELSAVPEWRSPLEP